MSRKLPTPIPVGAPHVAHPPMFERQNLATLENRNRREYSRRQIECDLWLIDGPSQSVLRCKTDNLSDAGLHVTAPIGYGLAVGQRFEARIAPPRVSSAMSAHLASSLGYATVVRTEIKVGEDGGDRVGCALQFDVPQLVPV